jgi:hypothetical protein
VVERVNLATQQLRLLPKPVVRICGLLALDVSRDQLKVRYSIPRRQHQQDPRTTVPVASAPSPTRKTPPKGEEAEGSPRNKAPRLDDAARTTVPVASAPSPTQKTTMKGGRRRREACRRNLHGPRRLCMWLRYL